MRVFLFLLLLLAAGRPHAQVSPPASDVTRHPGRSTLDRTNTDTRSDSLDILRTAIRIRLVQAPQITATAVLTIQKKIPAAHQLELDLEALPVDSVFLNDQAVPFTYASPKLRLTLPPAMPPDQPFAVRIHYHGQPVTDASGWGGFYTQGGYAYNLGVGFAADPHSFGRAWFPCFDNFVERCAFDVTALTAADKPAYGNGLLVEDVMVAGERSRRWVLEEPIPSYLACVAAGPYVSWKRSYQSIPVEIAAAAADTNKVAGTFQHLPGAMDCYRHWFGPYQWPKIGYSLVPFNAGAMEHATNVAIMRAAVDGTLGSETLWAHELSHHWWGDLATCSDAGDMWLNEGWAVYSEHLFTEWQYGDAAFKAAVWANFLNVLENAHVAEGGYRAVSGLPHELTYGIHTYNKGAVVAHNLRGYLGDTLFRQGVQQALALTSFDDWSSAEFRDKLQAATGQDLTHFFDGWVFNPGFPDFDVTDVQTEPSGPGFAVTVSVRQKRRGAPEFFEQVPLEFTFIDSTGARHYRTGLVSGENSEVVFTLGFAPRLVWLNTNQKILQARASREQVVTAAQTYLFAPAKMNVTLQSAVDSTLLRVDYHYAMPDTGLQYNTAAYRLTNRYWTVDADVSGALPASASIYYDGREALDQLDTELFEQTGPAEDSIILLFRPRHGTAWQEYPTYQRNPLGIGNDRFGLIRIFNLRPGQYTIAKGATTLSAAEPEAPLRLSVSPNPVRERLRVKASGPFQEALLVDAQGREVRTWSFGPATASAELDLSGLPEGSYWLVVTGPYQTSSTSFFIKTP